MIKVARVRKSAVMKALGRTGADGLTEAERASWYYTGQPPGRPLPPTQRPPAKAPVFEVYKSKEVTATLEQMFGGRCAYCESYYGHITPQDVEHYRPKGGYLDAEGKLVKPGYYWLAMAWDNLLPSCPDCNRERTKGHRRTGGRIVTGKSGKANKFPLAPGSPRADSPSTLRKEKPLLLHPCRDDPERHLQFELDGFVKPAESREEDALPKGLNTIEVCGLDRDRLRGRRYAVSLHLRGAMKSLCGWERKMRAYPDDPDFVRERDAAQQALDDMLNVSPEYLALTRGINAVFTAARAAASSYHDACDAWRKSSDDAACRAALLAAIARMDDLTAPDRPYPSFARDVLTDLGVPAAPQA